MTEIKKIIVEKAKEIVRNNKDPSDDFDVFSKGQNGWLRIHGTVSVRQKTPLPATVFGANVTIEGHYFKVDAGEAKVDYDLRISEINDNCSIDLHSVRIRGFNPIRMYDKDEYVGEVENKLLEEWRQ